MWGGPGAGDRCVVCAEPVSNDESEFEIEFVGVGSGPAVDRYHVHVHCFMAWELERNKLETERAAISLGDDGYRQ